MKFDRIFSILEDGARSVVMDYLGVLDVCHQCGQPFSSRVASNWRAGRRVHCAACDWTGSWRSGTILSGSTLSCSQYLLMCILLNRGVTDQKIAEFVGVHQDTVKAWRLRDAA